MISIAIAGAAGRTGRQVLEAAAQDDRFNVVAALTAPACPTCGTTLRAGGREFTITPALAGPCDVLIDFTVAQGTMAWLEVCRSRRIPMVTGVTGHNEGQLNRIREAAQTIPILKASNFSIGIHAILNILGGLAADLGDSYDIEIVESHHRWKVDAPSGTALTFVDRIAEATGRDPTRDAVFGRQGVIGQRPPGQIGVHAVRMGEIAGAHEIHFSGPGETVTIRHTAHSRTTFAAGALRAAAWIAGRQPGYYTLHDAMA
jgi:4-hydroxy-tetrahydrodipicolinate reductase